MSDDSGVEKQEPQTEFDLEHWDQFIRDKALGLSIMAGVLGWILFDDFSVGAFAALTGFCCFMLAKRESKEFSKGGPKKDNYLLEHQKYVEDKEYRDEKEAAKREKEAAKREKWYASKTNKFLNYFFAFWGIFLLVILLSALSDKLFEIL